MQRGRRFKSRDVEEGVAALEQLALSEKAGRLRNSVSAAVKKGHFYSIKNTLLPAAQQQKELRAFGEGIESGVAALYGDSGTYRQLIKDFAKSYPDIKARIFAGMALGGRVEAQGAASMFAPDIVAKTVDLLQEEGRMPRVFAVGAWVLGAFTGEYREAYRQAAKPDAAAHYLRRLADGKDFGKLAQFACSAVEPFTGALQAAITPALFTVTTAHLTAAVETPPDADGKKQSPKHDSRSLLMNWLQRQKEFFHAVLAGPAEDRQPVLDGLARLAGEADPGFMLSLLTQQAMPEPVVAVFRDAHPQLFAEAPVREGSKIYYQREGLIYALKKYPPLSLTL